MRILIYLLFILFISNIAFAQTNFTIANGSSNYFNVQGSNGNVGINSVNPTQVLDVQGTINSSLGFTSGASWNIGIGTSSPSQLVSVNGNASFNGGISTASWTDPINDWNASGQGTITTTGSISSSVNTTTLTVTSATSWSVGMGISIIGAGTAGANLITKVTTITGTTFTVANAAITTVSGAVIRHDDTAALQAAFNDSRNVHVRGGNYNFTSTLIINSAKIIIGDGVSPRGSSSSGSQTVLDYFSTTGDGIDFTFGYGSLKDMTVMVDSSVTHTSGYGLNVITSGATTDRYWTFDHDIFYNFNSGGQEATAGSIAAFNNVGFYVRSGGTGDGFLYNNPQPAGDNRFNMIDIRPVLGGTNSSGCGLHITNSDVTGFNLVKTIGFNHGLCIDTGSIGLVRIVNSSFENTTTAAALISTGNAISIIATEFLGGSSQTELSISSGFTGDIDCIGCQFNGSGSSTGIAANSTTAHVNIIAPVFSNVTTPYVIVAGATGTTIFPPPDGSNSGFIGGGNIGIGTVNPGVILDINGTIRMEGFIDTTNPTSGYVLTTNNIGVGTWAPAPSGSGTGTVTSVTFTGDGTVLSSTPSSAVTTSGTLTATTATQSANTILGATGTALSALPVGSCSGATNALTWTTGSGFGCNTISGGAGSNYWNLATGGNIGIDTINAVGIGTTFGNAGLTVMNGNVGIGTFNPQGNLYVSGNTGISNLASVGTSKGLLTVDDNINVDANPAILSISNGTTNFIAQSVATPAAGSGAGIVGQSTTIPTASGQRLGFMLLGALDSGTNRNTVGMQGFSDQSWTTGSAAGSYLTLETTPNGSTTRAERIRINNVGNVGIGSVNPGQLLDVQGTIRIAKLGFTLAIASGTNGCNGQATLSGGTVTVSTTCTPSTSQGIFLQDATTGSLVNVGTPTVGTITGGTSFVINSSNALDSSNVNWWILKSS